MNDFKCVVIFIAGMSTIAFLLGAEELYTPSSTFATGMGMLSFLFGVVGIYHTAVILKNNYLE